MGHYALLLKPRRAVKIYPSINMSTIISHGFCVKINFSGCAKTFYKYLKF